MCLTDLLSRSNLSSILRHYSYSHTYCYRNFFLYTVDVYVDDVICMAIVIIACIVVLIVVGVLIYRWMDSPRVLTAPKNFYDLQISLLNGHPLYFSDFV